MMPKYKQSYRTYMSSRNFKISIILNNSKRKGRGWSDKNGEKWWPSKVGRGGKAAYGTLGTQLYP